MKTWAPYDRLLAEDLNGLAQYLAGAGIAYPGVVCKVAGPLTAPAVNTTQECQLGAPAAGTDPLGYYQSGNRRLKVPAGLAGLHLVTFTVQGTAPAGTASNAGAFAHATLVGSLGVGVAEPMGSWARFDSTAQQGVTAVYVRLMADLEEWYVQANPRVVAGVDFAVKAWSILRLGPKLGAIGS